MPARVSISCSQFTWWASFFLFLAFAHRQLMPIGSFVCNSVHMPCNIPSFLGCWCFLFVADVCQVTAFLVFGLYSSLLCFRVVNICQFYTVLEYVESIWIAQIDCVFRYRSHECKTANLLLLGIWVVVPENNTMAAFFWMFTFEYFLQFDFHACCSPFIPII